MDQRLDRELWNMLGGRDDGQDGGTEERRQRRKSDTMLWGALHTSKKTVALFGRYEGQ